MDNNGNKTHRGMSDEARYKETQARQQTMRRKTINMQNTHKKSKSKTTQTHAT